MQSEELARTIDTIISVVVIPSENQGVAEEALGTFLSQLRANRLDIVPMAEPPIECFACDGDGQHYTLGDDYADCDLCKGTGETTQKATDEWCRVPEGTTLSEPIEGIDPLIGEADERRPSTGQEKI